MADGGGTYTTEGEGRIFIRGQRDGGLQRPGLDPDRVRHADGTLQPGGTEKNVNKTVGMV